MRLVKLFYCSLVQKTPKDFIHQTATCTCFKHAGVFDILMMQRNKCYSSGVYSNRITHTLVSHKNHTEDAHLSRAQFEEIGAVCQLPNLHPPMLPIFSYIMSDLSCKFHENLSMAFCALLLPKRHGHKSSNPSPNPILIPQTKLGNNPVSRSMKAHSYVSLFCCLLRAWISTRDK